MRTTPPIDPCIREYRHEQYLNVFDLCPDETRLFGTESLFGDWDARVLLLAQDFSTKGEIIGRALTCPRPYHHRHWVSSGKQPKGARTNKRLYELASRLPVPKLYGSAAGSLLKDAVGMSDPLPNWSTVRKEYAIPMLHFVAREADHLEAIACLGLKAWDVAVRAFAPHDRPTNDRFSQLRRETGHIEGAWARRRITIHPLFHPAARESKADIAMGWDALAARLGKNGAAAHADPTPDECHACAECRGGRQHALQPPA